MHKYLNQQLEAVPPNTAIKSWEKIYRIGKKGKGKLWAWGIFLLICTILALPWTQNIRANGSLTTIQQNQRPQEVYSIIPGKILNWRVKEGDHVKAGDTILQLGEIKVEYLDPQLMQRTLQQIQAKQLSAMGYDSKAATASAQTGILNTGRELKQAAIDNKMQQQRLKVTNDSMDLTAVENELSVYKRQLDAGQIMLDSGAISLIDFEKRKVSYQNGFAKKISAQNKLMQSKQEMTNLALERNITAMDYNDKISKAEGDRFSSLSNAASTQAEISKLENVYSNYDARNKMYYIVAPQSGQITRLKKAGIGELLKESEIITEIVPDKIDFAVEMYIEPMDLLLVQKGQKVRFIFDGVPAVVFSGWPTSSYGTFGGVVSAVETNVSDNGKFRVLVTEDTTDKPWPRTIRMGAGAQGIALLKDVPVIYELWRQVNGFPPEYYTANANADKQKKK
jgi:multidrug efflux pump subunit AcrA (membrane-fusion protein)